MSKHTPGPWVAIVPESRYIYNGTDITSFSVYTEKTRHKLSLDGLTHYRKDLSDVDNVGIATNQYINDLTLDEFVANAQLIAAAPELLEALKLLKASAERAAWHENTCSMDEHIERADAVIAKAEGRS